MQFLNDVIEDESSVFYYRSCTSDLCNSGTGLAGTVLSLSADPGASDNLLVKGLPGNSNRLTTSILMLGLSFIVIQLF